MNETWKYPYLPFFPVFTETIKSVTIINNTIPLNTVNFTLTCQVLGLYDAIYWMKDGMILSMNASSTNSSMYRIKNNTLQFTPATVQNNGTYRCVAVNKAAHHPSPDYILRVNCKNHWHQGVFFICFRKYEHFMCFNTLCRTPFIIQ